MFKGFWTSSLLLFGAYRIADLINLAIAFFLVPAFIDRTELGAVLPLTTLVTFIALPIFAFAMAVMKEAAVLSAKGRKGQLKSLYKGVFTAFAVFLALQPLIIAVILPDCLSAMRIDDGSVAFFAAAAAVLGCTAPVFTDALQSRKRFAALGTVEIVSALARFIAMLFIMPVKAMTGFFAGNAVQPLFRIAASLFAFRRELSEKSEIFWTRQNSLGIAKNFALITLYQALPMLACLVEQTVLRLSLPDADSAGYYMASRLSDLIHYITLPLLLVMFPYTAGAAAEGKPVKSFVRRCSLATLAVAAVLACIFALAGDRILSLMASGEYTAYAKYSPWLVFIAALSACQTFYTNSEVSAGRFRFLGWFAPLHLFYAVALWLLREHAGSIETVLIWMSALSLMRFILSKPLSRS